MKYCQNSHNCPWGSAIDPGMCAYSANINENDECPMIWQDAEYNMDRLISGIQPRELVLDPAPAI